MAALHTSQVAKKENIEDQNIVIFEQQNDKVKKNVSKF